MTEYAVVLLQKKLDKMATTTDEKISILNQSIVNGWQGVFALKEEQQSSGNVFLDIAREEGIL